MRGRASGFGARIASMVLLIATLAHWPDNLLDECDFVVRDAILCVKQVVRPMLCPLLSWHEGVNLACCPLGWLRAFGKNEKPHEKQRFLRTGASTNVPV